MKNIQIRFDAMNFSIIEVRRIVDFYAKELNKLDPYRSIQNAFHKRDYVYLQRIRDILDCLNTATITFNRLIEPYVDQEGGETNTQLRSFEVDLSILSLLEIIDSLTKELNEHNSIDPMIDALREGDYIHLQRTRDILDCLDAGASACQRLLELYIEQKGGDE